MARRPFIPEPTCKKCGNPIPRKPGEKTSKWKDVRYCREGDTVAECRAGVRAVVKVPVEGPMKSRGLPRNTGESSDVPSFEKYTPRVRPLLIDERTQAVIDKACHQRDIERMGLTRDPGRVLTAEERAEIIARGEITPIHLIPSCSRYVVLAF